MNFRVSRLHDIKYLLRRKINNWNLIMFSEIIIIFFLNE